MLPLLPTQVLDLTQMSVEEMNSRLETLFTQVIPQYTDFSLSHPENVLKEGMCLLTGMAVETMNEHFRQKSLATITDRLEAIRQGRPFGYELQEATACQVAGVFRIPNGALATKVIPIPAGTRYASADGDEFSSLTAASILVGQNASASITMENAVAQEDVFTSSETANMVIRLTKKNYIEDSLSLVAANGTYYRKGTGQVAAPTGRSYTSFLEMGPSTLGMILLADDAGYVYVFFGDSISGAIPRGTITCSYKTGGGEIGRIEAASVWKPLDTIYDIDGTPVVLELYNALASVGGTNATTVEEARIKIPLAIRTRERSVNEPDFELAATEVAGIATAALMTSNHDESIAEDWAKLYLVAFGTPYSEEEGAGYYPPAAPTPDQIASVEALIAEGGDYEQLMGGVVEVETASFLDVTVKVRIRKASGYTAAQVSASVRKEISKFFAVADANRARQEKIDFGFRLLDNDGDPDYKLSWSDVFNAIRDAEGVREITYDSSNLFLNDLHQSVVLQPKEFPRLSTIEVADMDQGGILI